MSEVEECSNELDCAICLQKCHHPTQLPCEHIFCFLCLKGVAIQSRKCAMCRAEIPSDYLDHPMLLDINSEESSTQQSEGYQWYYEGRNGWWKYDERSNVELEEAFNAGNNDCSLLLAGAVYSIDFQSMLQVRRSDPTRRRRVKRDVPTLPAKGIAGIKKIDNIIEQSKNNNDINVDEVTSNESEENTIHNTTEDLSSQLTEISDSVHRISLVNLEDQHIENQPD